MTKPGPHDSYMSTQTYQPAGQWYWTGQQWTWVAAPVHVIHHQAPARTRRAVTRPAFDHAKHIRRMVWTMGLSIPWYMLAYAYHRFGPTKAVTTWR
jgi:hypothetical protein